MSIFKFQQFSVQQGSNVHPVGTDSMVLGAFLSSENAIQKILDIGTGTGVLSLMCAQQFPTAEIIGIDTDVDSTTLAELNFSNSNWSSRLSAVHSSLHDFTSSEKFDLIVSNPPFYEELYLSPDENRNRQRNSESLPLTELIALSKRLLSESGCFWFIVPYRRKQETEELIQENQFRILQEIILQGKPNTPVRIIYAISFEVAKPKKQLLFTIRNDDGAYTEDYKQLTKEFHNRTL